MNHLPLVVRGLSLLAAAGVTALIVSVHAADMATLGARDVAATGAPSIAHVDTAGPQPAARVALVGSGAR